ncbi:MAG: zinc-binding dehydrogenase, partial [Actinomycetia bacterium]|nr:zinc-binding dehydrogenase [Actinomycetes bacterium]
AMKARVTPGSTVAVLGSGTMGLVTVAAVRRFTEASTVIASAKYPEQHALAMKLGADIVVKPSELARAVRRATGSFMIGDDLSGGADVVIDAVGTASSVDEAIGTARPRGRVVLVGMPGRVSVDLTALWHRETELVGAYTYGTEELADGTRRRTFDLATELVEAADLGSLVSATYPIDDYQDAITHAANAGARGAIKVCFDLR